MSQEQNDAWIEAHEGPAHAGCDMEKRWESTWSQPGQEQLAKMEASLLQNAGSTKMKCLTDEEILEIRDAIIARDGWDGDAWDLALGNAIQDVMFAEYGRTAHPLQIDDLEYARAMNSCRLQGRLEAFAMAMTECSKTEPRDDGYVGGRTWIEVRKAIDILHLLTLREIKGLENGS